MRELKALVEILGLDSLGFLEIEDLPKLATNTKCKLCDACFSGVYPVEPPKNTTKSKFETKFSENKND